MRMENVFCEDCGVSHFVEVLQQDRKGRIIQTRCHGKDFLPIQSNKALNEKPRIIKHRMRGYDIILKTKPQAKQRLPKMPTTFNRQPLFVEPFVPAGRVCVAEVSMQYKGQYLTIKVFEDATPDKFYEFFHTAGDKPTMTKPRNMGQPNPVHISEIAHIFKIESRVKVVYHKRAEYEKLLTFDPTLTTNILERNVLVSSGRR